jgi:hypothetical protein
MIPCVLSVSCNDTHALDLLLSSKGRLMQAQLSAHALYNVPNERSECAQRHVGHTRTVQRATWWRVSESNHVPESGGDRQMRRLLLGEIHLSQKLTCSFSTDFVSLSVRLLSTLFPGKFNNFLFDQYTVHLLLPEVVGLTFQNDLTSSEALPSLPLAVLPAVEVQPSTSPLSTFSEVIYDEPVPWPSMFGGVGHLGLISVHDW